MMRLSENAPEELLACYGELTGEVVATEERDGISFVSVLLDGVELSGVPADWFEVLT